MSYATVAYYTDWDRHAKSSVTSVTPCAWHTQYIALRPVIAHYVPTPVYFVDAIIRTQLAPVQIVTTLRSDISNNRS